MSWYQKGAAAVTAAQAQAAARDFPRIFWLPKGQARKVVLMDDTLFAIEQHAFRRPGDKGDRFVTCMSQTSPNAVKCCERLGPDSKQSAGHLTVLDCTPVPGSNGKTYQYGLGLLRLPGARAMAYVEGKKTAKTSLVNKFVEISRVVEGTASYGEWDVGDPVKDPFKMFELAEYKGRKLSLMWDEAERDESRMKALRRLFDLAIDPGTGKLVRQIPPFNYYELFKPPTPEEAGPLLAGQIEVGGYKPRAAPKSGTDASDGDDDTIPF